MSCDYHPKQATDACVEAGIPRGAVQFIWAVEAIDLPRCERCGRFVSLRYPQCRYCEGASGSVASGSGIGGGSGKRGGTAGGLSSQDVFARISRATRRASFQAQSVCPYCGGLKWGDGSVCPSCGDSGIVPATSIHPDSQWLAGDKDRVTADELAEAFASDQPTGRIRALIQFPGLAARLDGEGKEALWREVDRSPVLALFGHVPDVIAEIDGVEHVAHAARENPLAARASLRALPVIREHHPRGGEIADAIVSKGQEGE